MTTGTDSKMNITNTDKKVIELLNKHNGSLTTLPSMIGIFLYPETASRRYPQGMVLCGMRAMRRAEEKGLIKIWPSQLGFTFKLIPNLPG